MRKTTVDVKKLLKIPCCFKESMARDYLIDALQVCVYPYPLEIRRAVERGRALKIDERTVRDSSDLGLKPGTKVTLRAYDRGKVLSWTSPLGQHLQHVKNSPSMVVHMNLIRAAREALPLAERGRHRDPDNYIDTHLVSTTKARQLGFAFLKAAVEQLAVEYCVVVSHLFGYALRREDVRFTVNEIELAWDVYSPEGASLAAQRFESAWKRRLAEPSHVFELPRVHRGRNDGELKALGAGGEILKLYAKGWRFLRFEAQLAQKHVKALVGRTLRPDDDDDLRQVLGEVAERVFPEILGVQAEVGERSPVSLLDFIFAAGPSRHAERIVGPLLVNGSVKIFTPDSAGRDVLEKLRARGYVEIGRGKGVWVLSRVAAHLSEAVRRVDCITSAEVAS